MCEDDKLEYKLEVTSRKKISDEERKEFLNEIKEKYPEVEIDSPMIRKGAEPDIISIALLVVGGGKLLLELIKYIKKSKKYNLGFKKASDDDLIFIEDIDEKSVNNVGGLVIGEVKGDLVYKVNNDEAFKLKRELKNKSDKQIKGEEQD